MTNEFQRLGLRPDLVRSVSELGYEMPTPIQMAVIPSMLAGRDVIGQAQTGTGKTAAYALPILHSMPPRDGAVRCLVLAPTRELAIQVSRAIASYGQRTQTRVLAVYGGQSYTPQIRALRGGVEVVVGTPGRLLDLVRQGVLRLDGVTDVIVDEADEMLSMGFLEDIQAILAEVTSPHRTALFSATMPPEIRRLAEQHLQDPERIAIEPERPTLAAIEQRYHLVNESDRLAALTRLIEVEEITGALVFARTRARTNELAAELSGRGFSAEVLNGELPQKLREQVLGRLEARKLQVLVATDVAARGLDIDHLSHVFNYDLPEQPEGYVHRIGRTGRAGRTGIAITLATPREEWRIRRIEQFTRQPIARCEVPTAEAIEARRKTKLLERMKIWLERGRCSDEREIVTALAESGYDPAEIAAAALKLARAEETQRPIAPMGELRLHEVRRPPQGRTERGRTSHERGMVRLSLSAGKAHGVRPNDVVATLARGANIPGRTLGAIRIDHHRTLVDVPERLVGRVLALTGHCHIHRRPVELRLA